jgi:hypothetical protein
MVNVFYAYIVMLILLPTGNIYGVNVKMLVFLPLLVGAFQRMARETDALNSVSWNLLIFCSFFAWALVFLFPSEALLCCMGGVMLACFQFHISYASYPEFSTAFYLFASSAISFLMGSRVLHGLGGC